jgi:hypothetical protein
MYRDALSSLTKMPRDNEAIIKLLHQTQTTDRELLKRLIEAEASHQTLGMVVERLRLSEDAINWMGEEQRERTPFPSGLIGGAVACRPSLSSIPVPGEYRFSDVEVEGAKRLLEEISLKRETLQVNNTEPRED